MKWRKHLEIPEDSHAFLGGSKYSWTNMSEDELVQSYNNYLAVQRGTILHNFACDCIKLKQRLPDVPETLNMYVNDAIDFNMTPEQPLYYSPNAFGKADAISFEDYILRIHDLKTGKIPASFRQLEVYTSLFLLEYDVRFSDLRDIELRIYQNNKVMIGHPKIDDILPIMDKLVSFDRMIARIKEDNYYGS